MKLVAFLDILGFTNLVRNNSFKELEDIYEIFERAFKNSISLDKMSKSNTGIQFDVNDTHVKAIQISDSIILWTKEDSIRAYYDLILVVRGLLAHGMFNGLPLRACIDYGEFGYKLNPHSEDIITNTFFGKSITTSYSLCESQNWSGGFMTKKAVLAYNNIVDNLEDDYLRSLVSMSKMQERHFLKLYNVPFKISHKNSIVNCMFRLFRIDRKSEEMSINWVSWTRSKGSKESIPGAFEKHKKKVKTKHVRMIVKNTVDFWKSCPQVI